VDTFSDKHTCITRFILIKIRETGDSDSPGSQVSLNDKIKATNWQHDRENKRELTN